jgi:SSS family solute:Na+ symporter
VVYTVFGGIKAVIYTDTFQWSVLMIGLVFIGIPIAYYELGGYDSIAQNIPNNFLSLTNVSWVQLINWGVTIIPIWFVGMTLYQRIFACRDEKTAKKAWYIAGLFEWPVMAFMGIILGLMARVAADQGLFIAEGFTSAAGMDPEIGLPMLLKTVLPVGLTGLVLSSYFSAIMSTADSCLLAASGNFVTDILGLDENNPRTIRISQIITFGLGAAAILIATSMTQVLDLMLLSYSFMVSGLLVPVVGMLFSKKKKPLAAMLAMLLGGATTITLEIVLKYTGFEIPFGFKPVLIGLVISLLLYLFVNE